jgi:hypothetical protein
LVSICHAIACGSGGELGASGSASNASGIGLDGDSGESEATAGSSSAGVDGETKFDLGSSADDTGAAPICPPPDLMIVLDRSYSMHQQPDGETPPDNDAGYESTKWFIIIGALETFMQDYSGAVRFGLALFPGVSVQGPCGSMPAVVGDTADQGDLTCTAEVLSPPADDAADTIATELDPFATLLCKGTPIQIALDTAAATLADGDDGQEQFVALVTDGKERCAGNPLAATQQLAQAGVHTYVIGFGDTHSEIEGHTTLNHLACAGQTAVGFPGTCVADGFGNYSAADADDPALTLYLAAEDGDSLAMALDQGIAGTLCCGSACPPG